MNLQALMKQAQSMQKNIMDSKKKIDEMTFTGKSELVEVKINGKREVLSVEIKSDELEKDPGKHTIGCAVQDLFVIGNFVL